MIDHELDEVMTAAVLTLVNHASLLYWSPSKLQNFLYSCCARSQDLWSLLVVHISLVIQILGEME
jgi:hypothetical protein